MRYSSRREAILRIVQGTQCHPTADWVYSEARKQLPGISLGTVYRNLKLLSESGQLHAYEGAGGVSRFDGCVTEHYHFRCQRCGVMVDVQEPVDRELDRRVAERTGLRVNYHVLEFRGLCVYCQQNGTESVTHE